MQLCKLGVNLYISDVAYTNMNALSQKVVVKKRDDDIGGGQ